MEEQSTPIASEIRQFLKRYIDGNKFTDSTNIFEEGFVNSLFTMDLIVFIENNYGMKIENEDLKIENFSSVAAIASLIEKKI